MDGPSTRPRKHGRLQGPDLKMTAFNKLLARLEADERELECENERAEQDWLDQMQADGYTIELHTNGCIGITPPSPAPAPAYIDPRALRTDIKRLAAAGCPIQIGPLWRGRVRHGVAYSTLPGVEHGKSEIYPGGCRHQFQAEYTRNDSGWNDTIDGDPIRFKTGPKQRALYALVQDIKTYLGWTL